MKKLTRSLFIALLIVITLVSCHHRYPTALVEADSLLYSNPEMALSKLDSAYSCMDTSSTTDVKYLQLLRMLAKDRVHTSINEGVKVLEILKYYQGSKELPLLAKAYYLQGRNMQNLHDSPQALVNYQMGIVTKLRLQNRIKDFKLLSLGMKHKKIKDKEQLKENLRYWTMKDIRPSSLL